MVLVLVAIPMLRLFVALVLKLVLVLELVQVLLRLQRELN